MKIAFLGLGKLGLPVALTLAHFGGHDVTGWDTGETVRTAIAGEKWPHAEPGVVYLLESEPKFQLATADSLVPALDEADLICVAVQTPHPPGYGGEMPRRARPPRDFEYTPLAMALATIDAIAPPDTPVAVISTVLPGTYRRHLSTIVGRRPYAYTPCFAAMGSVIHDLHEPEFVLVGADDERSAEAATEAWKWTGAPVRAMSVVSAELTKVAYNLAISSKIVFANALMEIAHKTGADVDDVTDTLALGTKRITSGRYMHGGLGDGGACHPRDAIAMTYLADSLDLSADPFGFVSEARERQSHWLAYLVAQQAKNTRLPIVVCGRAYKRGTAIEDGSAALLLAEEIEDTYGFEVAWAATDFPEPAVYVLATGDLPDPVPPGSVVIDPWGVTPDMDGVRVIRIGRGETSEVSDAT